MNKRYVRKLAKFTNEVCGKKCNLKLPNRCCDKTFCSLAKHIMPESIKEKYLYDSNAELPYMGENGCRVDPADRPGCSGYVCPENIKGDWGRKYRKLCDRAGIPPMEYKEVSKLVTTRIMRIFRLVIASL